jgi:hypothetical protein
MTTTNDSPFAITEDEARQAGYRLVRGAYQGTTDDRLDAWYIDLIDGDTIDRRGAGYPTKEAALEALGEHLSWDLLADQDLPPASQVVDDLGVERMIDDLPAEELTPFAAAEAARAVELCAQYGFAEAESGATILGHARTLIAAARGEIAWDSDAREEAWRALRGIRERAGYGIHEPEEIEAVIDAALGADGGGHAGAKQAAAAAPTIVSIVDPNALPEGEEEAVADRQAERERQVEWLRAALERRGVDK